MSTPSTPTTTRPIGLSPEHVAAVRTVSGSPVTTDAAPYADAHCPPIPDPTTGGAIDTTGFATIWLGVEVTGGGGITVTILPLVRDDGAPDGSRWKSLIVNGAALQITPPLAGFVEVRVDGRLVFPVLASIEGAPTGVTLLAFPGTRLGGSSVDV